MIKVSRDLHLIKVYSCQMEAKRRKISGAAPIESIKHLLNSGLSVLNLLSNLKLLYPELHDFELVLLRVMKYGIDLLPTDSDFDSCNANTAGIGSTMDACLRRFVLILSNLKEKKANFFGVFRQSFYLDELKNVERKVLELLDTKSTTASDEVLIEDLSSRLFWIKYFGQDVCDVPWSIFEDAFLKEFGTQPPESLSKLKQRLVGSSKTESFECDKLLNIYDYDSFCLEHHGLYQSFQQLVDPGKVVFLMGTISDENDSPLATSPIILESLLGVNIAQLSCGGQHVAALTDTGSVFTWGRGRFGRLGHGHVNSCDNPQLVTGLAHVVLTQVACGFAYTAAVTTDGELFTWGAGENGRLGTGDTLDCLSPTKVVALSDNRIFVEQVFAGSVHTCVLSREGSIYSFGKSEYTGHGLGDDVRLPHLLDAFQGKNVCQISVGPGGYHTLALTITGDVYAWGHNRVGQLGYQNENVAQRNVEGAHFLPTPMLVQNLPPYLNVCQVVAGWGHSAIVTKCGELWVCGRNFKGQLGLGDPSQFPMNERGHNFQNQFVKVESLHGKKVIQVSCGGEHTVALLESGECYVCGSNSKGQLGLNETPHVFYPTPIRDLQKSRRHVKQVACGNNCTLVLAGKPTAPPLFTLCLERIRNTPILHEFVTEQQEESGLPTYILDHINNT